MPSIQGTMRPKGAPSIAQRVVENLAGECGLLIRLSRVLAQVKRDSRRKLS